MCIVLFYVYIVLRKKEPTRQETTFKGNFSLKTNKMRFLRFWKYQKKKFTRASCWINSEKGNRGKNTTTIIFSFHHHFRSLGWYDYRNYLLLWSSTSWNHLKLTVQIQLALHPCDSFLMNNRNIIDKNVEK